MADEKEAEPEAEFGGEPGEGEAAPGDREPDSGRASSKGAVAPTDEHRAPADEPVADDDGGDSEGEAAPRRPKKKRKKQVGAKEKTKKRKKAPPPATERALDSPTVPAIVSIAIIAGMTLFMWGFAKFACNAHPAQSKPPKPAPTERLVRTPKDAAIELQHRIATFQFGPAKDLAKPGLAARIGELEKACEAEPATCEKKRQRFTDLRVMTTGMLLEATPGGSAKVRVQSHAGDEPDAKYLVDLVYEGGNWKATARILDDGKYVPSTPVPDATALSPSGSAQPSGSVPALLPSGSAPAPNRPSPTPRLMPKAPGVSAPPAPVPSN